MSTTPFQALACPLDGTPLHCTGSAWTCASGHSFDIASQGYTNLLPVQHKRSRDPGDSKEMVAARGRFLTAGFYQPIATAVSRAVLVDLPAGATGSCLDAGCGEGYYLRQLAAAVPDEQTLELLGLDISKWAVLAAPKRDRRVNWVVGSNTKLPVLPGALDRVLCLFGFPVYPEFARVLKPGGRLLQVDAGPDHLRELSVLSGNRNFEARVHQNIKANFLMSPPLVVAFALAGRVPFNVDKEPIGAGKNGPVYLKDIWPSDEEVAALLHHSTDAAAYKSYANVGADNPLWDGVPAPTGAVYEWDAKSTYIQEPPFFPPSGDTTGAQAGGGTIKGARALAIFGDSVTTDHISSAGGIKPTSPAGLYLTEHGVA